MAFGYPREGWRPDEVLGHSCCPLDIQASVAISLVHLIVPDCLAFEAADFLPISLQDEAWWGASAAPLVCLSPISDLKG